ncbi:MAG: glutathione S-transferase family protein [Pseudobacteriovorax sp.]|nr:glutathione S-transferase family protein [Pseudobacteriovorax sp.]
MIELIVYPKSRESRLINPSPFCAKTEILLRLLGLKYSITEFKGNPGKFPYKKLPVIKDQDQIIADSSLIQDYLLRKHNLSIDEHLNKEDCAIGFAFCKMLEEFFYWSLLHERWFIDENWNRLKQVYFSHIPKIIRNPFTTFVRAATKKSAIGHGMSRHTDENIMKMGKTALNALSDFLGEKAYLLGDKPSSYDTTAFAFVASILHSPLGPTLKQHGESLSNLKRYDERMYESLFQS